MAEVYHSDAPQEASALRWAIFSQFAGYVTGMSDGRILVGDGARVVDDVYEFPLDEVREEPDGIRHRFRGSVRFVGHGGLLNLPISALEVRVHGVQASIEIADPDDPAIRLTFATGFVAPGAPGTLAIRIDPVLEDDGAELFFYRYPRGLALDPLEITKREGQDRR